MRDFINYNNPVATALLSKMGYSKEERVQVELEFLRTLTRLEINKLQLDEEERIMELRSSWRLKGIEEGIEKGKLDVAKRLIDMGMSVPNIAEDTGLSPEKIEKLKKEN